MGRIYEQTFPQRRYHDGQQMRRCSSSLITREIQIKTTMRYLLTPVRKAKINNTRNNTRCGERGAFSPCWQECKLVQPLWKTVWRFFKKLKIELPYDPAIALLGIYTKNTKILIQRDTRIPMFIVALSIVVKLWKQPKCPLTNECIKKIWYMYTIEYHSAITKNESLHLQ